jgi:oligoribonuclease NrnB/cAMP/cGMP phosphodiesterase (DHH superfamily)
MKKFVFYHKNCADGFGAAMAAWRKFGEVDTTYIPINYDETVDINALSGHDVYILDFSFPMIVMHQIIEVAHQVLVCDHHKTSEPVLGRKGWPLTVQIFFDTSHSGAYLAWYALHGETQIPEIVRYIEDRDLWLFKLVDSREVSAAIRSYTMDFCVWDKLFKLASTGRGINMLASAGCGILRSNGVLVNEVCKRATMRMVGLWNVPVVNTQMLISETAHHLLELYPDAPFAACYYIIGTKEYWSLRSRKNFDVSAVAKRFSGGGGHAQAAGFTRKTEVVLIADMHG